MTSHTFSDELASRFGRLLIAASLMLALACESAKPSVEAGGTSTTAAPALLSGSESGTSAGSRTSVARSYEDASRISDVVVVGTIRSEKAKPLSENNLPGEGGYVVRVLTIDVGDVLLGSAGDTLEMLAFGWFEAADGTRQNDPVEAGVRASGFLDLAIGDEVLLFLRSEEGDGPTDPLESIGPEGEYFVDEGEARSTGRTEPFITMVEGRSLSEVKDELARARK